MLVLVGMQLRNHVNTWAVKRYRGYAAYIRYQIWTVASAREWDFTTQVVCWNCAFAHRRGNTASGSRNRYIENRCHRALNVYSSPMNSSHSEIISNEWFSIREYEWAKYSDVYLGSSHPLKPELPSTNKHFFKYNSYQIECFLKHSICIDKFPFENNFKRTKILFSNGLIRMSLVCRELTGIMNAL